MPLYSLSISGSKLNLSIAESRQFDIIQRVLTFIFKNELRMYRIIYVSFLKKGTEIEPLIKDIKEKSASKNPKHYITGKLLYSSNTFLQLVEGPKVNVDVLYAIIKNDPRHKMGELIFENEVNDRLYPDFDMMISEVHGLNLNVINKVLKVSNDFQNSSPSDQEILKKMEELENFLIK